MVYLRERGWIPPENRSKEQQALTNLFHEQLEDVSFTSVSNPPERVIFEEGEKKANGGKILKRLLQLTGSCVGAAAWRAYAQATAGDILRGDQEEMKYCFPWATYGIGREIAGMRGRGEGSFGGAQAKAVERFGMLPIDSEFVKAPTERDGWYRWTSSYEFEWSHPRAWRQNREKVEAEAEKNQMTKIVRIRNSGDAVSLLSQFYGVTIASMYGTSPRIQEGVLLGRWNRSWAHQMSVGGYWYHPELGLIFKIDNQWGPAAHGRCPVLEQYGCFGSFWCLESDFDRICRTGEAYGHSATEGFPSRMFDWGDMGFPTSR